MPGVFLYGLNDIQNKFIIQMNKSHLILGTQSSALVIHICFNYLFVRQFNFGIIGCAFATLLTYVFIYLVNKWKLS